MNNNDIFLKGQIAKDFDFYRIRETVSNYATSEEGKELLLNRESSSCTEEILKLKKLGREWFLCINSNSPQIIKAWPPIKDFFPILNIEGSSLLHEQIFALGLFCAYTQEACEHIKTLSLKLEIEELAKIANSMPSLQNAKNEIFSILDISTGEVKDLPALRQIRSRILALRKEIETSLRKYTSDTTLNSVLQSNVPALKGDRELLAVRADHRSSIKGIVHEVSSSGQTLYIEPEEIVRANNEIVQEEFNLQCELNKIFKELTDSLRKYYKDLTVCHEAMLLLDVTYATAKYQKDIHGIFCEECNLELEPPSIKNARHPLLGAKAVPVTIDFMNGKNVMIITGPNTGGKTVTLKTVALFALMNQAGFPIPADEGTRLPFFDSIFADIGDEQSIDESLSTFSSRMKKIALALNNATSKSLVLLDELGSGTDPLEGSAIAMATLDSLLEKKSFVLVTTHHGVLKNYGYTNPKCVNACVEFNSETLKPTYRLLMGIPGESHALDIASNSGLPKETVEQAKKYISTEQADVSSLIKGLTQKHSELDDFIKTQKEKEKQILLKEFLIQNKEAKLLQKELELKELEHSKSFAFLRETRSKLENLVRVLREGEITREKTLGMRKFISDISEEIDNQEKEIENTKNILAQKLETIEKQEETILENGIRLSKNKEKKLASNKKTKQKLSNSEALKNATALNLPETKKRVISKATIFTEGLEVFAGEEKRKGTLIRKVKDGIWQVQFGSLKMNVPQKQLIPAEKKQIVEKVSVVLEKNNNVDSSSETPKFELRLLGMRYEEAIKALEHQLDLCLISSFKSFSIIHGKGNGILQQAVHDYLSHYPGIKDFHFARPEEGGSGKTYVELE